MPRWSRDGSELFFVDNRRQMVAARVRTTPSFEVVALQPLFSIGPLILDQFHQAYDVTSDGGFIFTSARQLPGARAPRVVRVDNWFRDLQARLPR